MKKFLFLVFVLATSLMSVKTYGQDIITKKDGSEINAKVLEVISTEVKYKKFDNQTGPTYSMQKSEILMVKYENGTKDIFANESSNVPNAAPANVENKKNVAFNSMAKGQYFISPNLAYTHDLNLGDGVSVLDLSLNFDNGYFVCQDLAVTTTIGCDYYHIGTSSSSSSSTYEYYTYSYSGEKIWHTGYGNQTNGGASSNTILFTYGAGLRYYIAGRIFLGASLISKTKTFSNNTSSAYFQVGYAHFLTKNFAIESSANYVMGIGDNDAYKAIQIKIGVGYYF